MKGIYALCLTVIMMTACGSRQTPTRQTTDEGNATQMGHEAAWAVAHTDHADTIALQRAIIDARSMHDRYVLAGDDDLATEFEQAFADSLRKCDPQLAGQIF